MKWTKIWILITAQLILKYFAKFNIIYYVSILQQGDED